MVENAKTTMMGISVIVVLDTVETPANVRELVYFFVGSFVYFFVYMFAMVFREVHKHTKQSALPFKT